jgi:hypothetical protein
MNSAQSDPTIGMNVEIINIRAVIKTPFTISFTSSPIKAKASKKSPTL